MECAVVPDGSPGLPRASPRIGGRGDPPSTNPISYRYIHVRSRSRLPRPLPPLLPFNCDFYVRGGTRGGRRRRRTTRTPGPHCGPSSSDSQARCTERCIRGSRKRAQGTPGGPPRPRHDSPQAHAPRPPPPPPPLPCSARCTAAKPRGTLRTAPGHTPSGTCTTAGPSPGTRTSPGTAPRPARASFRSPGTRTHPPPSHDPAGVTHPISDDVRLPCRLA